MAIELINVLIGESHVDVKNTLSPASLQFDEIKITLFTVLLLKKNPEYYNLVRSQLELNFVKTAVYSLNC